MTTTTDTTSESTESSPEQDENPSPDSQVDNDQTPPEQDGQDADEQPSTGNAEAARYRVRLRETEAERDALTARVEGYLRADAERVLTPLISVPSDLWEIGRVELADVLGEDGEVDPAKVEAAAEALTAERPGLAVPKPRRGPSSSGMGRSGRVGGPSQRTWAGELRR